MPLPVHIHDSASRREYYARSSYLSAFGELNPGTENRAMDFDQLETFLEVAKHNSFSRAAEKRFRTQPAISSLIRSLEEEVGAKLFDRSGGKVALTGAGKLFQKFAEDALELRRVSIAKIGEMERVPRGEIIVGANEGTCLHILPEVFANFKKLYPDVQVSVLRAERGRILDFIIDNTVDFGIVSMPVGDNRLTIVQIHRDDLVLMTPPDHPLAKKKEVTVAETADYPLLLPKVGRTRESVDNLFHERRIKPNISMELDSSELMKRFVAANVGIGFIAGSHVKDEVRTRLLATARLADANIRRDLALVFRKDKALSRAALAFIDIAVKLRPAEMGAAKLG
jgi:DNA-binding transcriptional LysR family regulator